MVHAPDPTGSRQGFTPEPRSHRQGFTPKRAWSQARTHTLAGRVLSKVLHCMEGPIPYLSCLYIFDVTLMRTRNKFCVCNNEAVTMANSIWLWLETKVVLLESWSGRMFVLEVVHIQCAKLFKGLKCVVMSMALYTIKNLRRYLIRVGHSPFLLSRYCHDFAESNVKQYSLEITTRV